MKHLKHVNCSSTVLPLSWGAGRLVLIMLLWDRASVIQERELQQYSSCNTCTHTCTDECWPDRTNSCTAEHTPLDKHTHVDKLKLKSKRASGRTAGHFSAFFSEAGVIYSPSTAVTTDNWVNSSDERLMGLNRPSSFYSSFVQLRFVPSSSSLFLLRVNLPSYYWAKVRHNLGSSPVHCRARWTQTTTHLHTHLKDNLDSLINPWTMFLDCGRKLEKTHVYTSRTSKLHTERAQLEFEPSHCEIHNNITGNIPKQFFNACFSLASPSPFMLGPYRVWPIRAAVGFWVVCVRGRS